MAALLVARVAHADEEPKVHGAIAFWADALYARGTASMVPAGSPTRVGAQIGTGGAPVLDLGTFSLRGDYLGSLGYGGAGLEGHVDAWLGVGVRGYLGGSSSHARDPNAPYGLGTVSIANHGPFVRALFGGEYTGNDDLVLSYGGFGATAGYEIASTRRLAEVGAVAMFAPSGRWRAGAPTRSLDATRVFGLAGSLLGPPLVLRGRALMLRPREGDRSDPIDVLFGQACAVPIVASSILGIRGDAIEICADVEYAWGTAFTTSGATSSRALVAGVSIGFAQFGGLVSK